MKSNKYLSAVIKWKIFLVGLILLTSPHAFAGKSAGMLCDDVAHKANRVLWDELRKAADETVCRKPWTKRTPGEFLACGGMNKAIKLSSNPSLFT